ncbi:putative UDP-rhamnose:rhamnosyltransferase 1 [Dichanthelium oligosanthes]|uniref:Putative UDP-rhamnose:rhamnosyltransferase 1 n=1 Tax=Dichanthelium oligosanthes TaxID=888268 RepID=A0A1E5UQ64_9POAL|nr:putative UDP-rhamnose:rhamnosyltransferase 1 [Dichanthelium oligosanthes]
MGLGEHAKTKLEHLTEVPGYVPFPTTVAYRGHEVRAMIKPGMIPDDSEVSEGYRIAKSVQESQLVGVRSSREFEPEGLQLQAPRSVVYVAFGSEAKLTSAQQQAIALGLEASGVPFLWAHRAPADSDTGDVTGGLPEGFEERVNGQVLVCRGWVPQVRFLAHGSVGGFLTHAGLNSITEGLARGVRLVLLPLLFDQGLNARHLVEKKIAIEVAREEEDGSFTAEDVAAALRRVMLEDEGEEIGAKVQELAKVLGSDEVNDQCVRDFLRCLSECSRPQQR